MSKVNKFFNRVKSAIIVVFLFNISCANEDAEFEKINNTDPDKIAIILNDNTVFRLDPNLYSTIISYIPKGNTANVVDRSQEKTLIGESEEYWYKVKLSSGAKGWIYGNNIKIFPTDDKKGIERYIGNFWKAEKEKMTKCLFGRWQMSDRNGSLKDKFIDLYEDWKYKSYQENTDVIEGEYSFNFSKREINFLNGAYFGSKINIYNNGRGYILQNSKDEIRFIKIRAKIESVE